VAKKHRVGVGVLAYAYAYAGAGRGTSWNNVTKMFRGYVSIVEHRGTF
jgi:hypothetical protein